MIVEFTEAEREQLEAEAAQEKPEEQLEAEAGEETEELKGEEEKESELEESGEDADTVPFTYYDEVEQKEKVVNLSYDKLSKIVENYMSGRDIEQDAQRMAEYLAQVTPLVNQFNSSELLKQIAYYQSQGYDDETIKKGLIKLWMQQPQEAQQQTQEFQSPQEELSYIIEQTLEKKLKHYLRPYETQIQALANTYTGSMIEQQNNQVLAKALERYDINEDNITKEDIELFNKALMDAYPGIDLRKHQITQQQAYIVANEAFGRRRRKNEEAETKFQQIKNTLKQAKAPSIMPGKSTRQGAGLVRKIDGLSDEERRKNWIDLIG